MRKPLRPAIQIIRRPMLLPVVARKVAYENAQRIFKLDIIKPGEYPFPAGLAARNFSAKNRASGGATSAAVRTRLQGILSESQIRSLVVVNTLNFDAPSNGGNCFIYFGEDGEIRQKVAGGPRVVRKMWFFDDR
jgi:hypothetical protein